ncbi:MAG: ATP-binding protein [Lachnospiraceae bacterium]|nr:ATP-binding protein [Lachnospiraceae bacterium]
MKIIERADYLSTLFSLCGTPDIKIITGIRRCGKSVLMQAFAESLHRREPDTNIININLQDLDLLELKEYRTLHTYCMDHHKKGTRNVIIIDEVQLCDHFELAVNSLHSKNMFDIYLTGSNAFLLSSDLATLFTGRTMEVRVFPFSFSEYLSYFGAGDNIDDDFDAYVRAGGLPGAYTYEDEKMRYDYVSEVYRTILLRDLVQKYNIRNRSEFARISDFMQDNIGNILSANSICDALNKDQSTITVKTVQKYISYLENAFLLYGALRYDLKGKKYLRSGEKYYLSDPGIRYAVLGTRNMDFGRMYENIVYMELLRRGYHVYVGKLYKNEVDFVAYRQNERSYIQVSDDISSEKTFKRETSSLLAIPDAYPKLIIARTRHEDYYHNGIQIKDLARWLSKNK